ncbi:MAG: DUF1353 domain-containing protein [Pseudomonadota bacterium]
MRLIVLFIFFILPAVFAKAHEGLHSKLIQNWMQEAQSTTMAPRGLLHLVRFKEPVYVLTRPIKWEPNEEQQNYEEVTVPKGFVTDFASIPSLFWTHLRPDGSYAYAAVIHDYLYWEQKRSRKEADEIFLLAMKDFGISWPTDQLIYNAVRLDVGGGRAWRDVSRAKENGEKRILRRFPQDPRTSWFDWKKMPGVFNE